MYKVFIKDPDGRISDKTVTRNPFEAEDAFRALLRRDDLKGQKLSALLTLDNRELHRHRYDFEPGIDGYLAPDAELDLFDRPY